MPIPSTFADVEIPEVDIWHFLFERPDKPFKNDQVLLIDANTTRSYTFEQVKAQSIDFGQGLKSLWKWKKADVLAFYSPNSIDTTILTAGVHWAGGIASPANPLYTAKELAFQMKDSGAKALVTQIPFLPIARQAAAMAGVPEERIILMGDGRDESGKFKHFTDISAKQAWVKPSRPKVDAQDLAFLVYSSGTTGLPKGVMLSHYNVVANICQLQPFDMRYLSYDRDTQLAVLPFFHIYGLTIVLLITVWTGIRSVVMAKFDLEHCCQLIEKYNVTFTYVPPPIVLGLQKHPIVSKYDLSSLRFINSAAAPLSVDLVDGVWKRLKVGVKQGYGLSETSPATHIQSLEEFWKYVGSVGKLAPNMQAKIVDPEGKEVARGEQGELLMKGPNVFRGYLNRPELNKDNFTEDGFFKTGDIVYMDSKDNYYITDRLKELIKYNGFQVPPAELESLLVGREDIADACVIGIWDEQRQTEVPRAYIVMRQGVTCDEARGKEICDWVTSKVTAHKRLRGGVRFVKEVPKSAAGKILRRVLRDQAKAELKGEQHPRAKL